MVKDHSDSKKGNLLSPLHGLLFLLVMQRWFHGLLLLALLLIVVVYAMFIAKSMDQHQTLPWGWKYYTSYMNGTGNILVNNMVGCTGLFDGNKAVQSATKELEKHWKYVPGTPAQYIALTQNCSVFVKHRKYITRVSPEESSFPIAFSMMVYRDIEQVERLLRTVYRRSNVYCIHVDDKVSSSFKNAIRGIANCFDNVFLSSRSVNVIWGKFSVLEPELICMQDLLKRPGWKYFINLTGQEFPLKTNRELVPILRAFAGASDIEGVTVNIPDRKERWGPAGKLPHGLTPVKGAVHIVANRHFVTYALTSDIATDLLAWVKKTGIPDETFFSTLNHNSQLAIPGSYNGTLDDNTSRPYISRFKIWTNTGNSTLQQCYGKYVRDICIFGISDLPKLKNRTELFANKFNVDFEPLAYDCMEQNYFRKVQEEERGRGRGRNRFNVSFYTSLAFVKHQIEAQ